MLLNPSRQYILYLISMALFLAAPLAWAQAPVTIIDKVSLDFGVIANENGTCKMSSAGVLTGVNGQTCTGTGALAEFQINGEKNYVVSILVAGSTRNGVTLSPFVVGGSSKVIAKNGRLTIKIHGDLTLNNVPPAGTGSTNVSYLVSVNYN